MGVRTLRAKILIYLIVLHVVLGAISVLVLIEQPALLLAVEALFVVSAIVGYLLLRAFFVPLELIRTGAELMREQEFTTHFRRVGQSEMDDLVEIYNGMVDRLREERLELEERDLFVEKIVQASPTALIILDHDGKLADLNPTAERLLGVGPSEVRGRRLGELAPPLGPALERAERDRSFVVALGPKRLKCHRAEFFDRGAARSFFLVDELTEELRESERAAYGKVIRLMSHEVHNSVGAVRSLLESSANFGAQLAGDDRQDFEQAIEVASSRLQHLSKFMNELASVVRVPDPERRPCDVVALLRDLETLLRPELERRSIRLTWRIDEPLAAIPLDKNQIERVLVNILRNAIEAVDANGEIVVASGRQAGRPWLAIRDSGPGIPEEARSQLFTPFFSTKRDGQGVGLTLSREILARHGFALTAENPPAGGAEFRIGF